MGKGILLFCLLAALVAPGWGHGQGGGQAYVEQILKDRRKKNDEFRGKSSPLRKEDKKNFDGLHYFEVDTSYRYEVALHRLEDTPSFRMVTNTGEQRKAVRYGYFEFELDGKSQRLYAYKLEDVPKKLLFVPFTDATSGHGSYAGGRYLDLEENDTGRYVLDFNQAYNPYCAYGSGRYSCPIPPAENRLDAAIRAGEKAWENGHKK